MSLYSDINSINPTSKPLLEDFQSIYQALITLFNTRPGEILFNPEYGVDIEDSLFEIIDNVSASNLYNQLIIVIEIFEPRVIIDNSNSRIIAYPDKNRFELNLQYTIQGLNSTQNFELVGSFNQPQ